MKWFLGLVAVILVLLLCSSVCMGQSIPGGHYFGQTPPGFNPEIFAPGIISLTGRYEYCCVFSPNLDECVFGLTNANWSVFTLRYTRMDSDSTWTDPVYPPFEGSGDGLFPCYSGDGNDIYFASTRPAYPPANIWRSARDSAGWALPVKLDPPINSTSNEWGGSLTDDGTFYFSSDRPGGFGGADLYRAVTAPGGEVTVENLGATVNSPQLEGSACVARDGSSLIFESQRPGGHGYSDLYITYNESGVWTTPRNLGFPINTSQFEDGCSISPDGKYLFFNRRKAYVTTENSEIWWVDAEAVFHPEQSDVNDPGGSMGDPSILRIEPNPFGASTSITYSTPSSGFVAINIYDVLGRKVGSLVNTSLAAGTHSVEFVVPPDARPADGVYFCSLQVGDKKVKTAKLVSLR